MNFIIIILLNINLLTNLFMKFFTLIILIVISTLLVLASESVIETFTAKSDGYVITIEWKTSDENGISRFEVERANNNKLFKKITSEDAKGYPTFYKFIDTEAFQKTSNNTDETQITKDFFL